MAFLSASLAHIKMLAHVAPEMLKDSVLPEKKKKNVQQHSLNFTNWILLSVPKPPSQCLKSSTTAPVTLFSLDSLHF